MILLLTLAVFALILVMGSRLQDVTYPTVVQLREVEQVLLPTLTEDDPVFDEFPIEEDDHNTLRWEQQDNYVGLQQVTGYNGSPNFVKMVGSTMFEMNPGVYRDFTTISEDEMTRRRQYGSWDQPISIDDLVGRAQTYLLQRRLDRIRWVIWTLLSTGTFVSTDAAGRRYHYDTFPLKTLTASVPWATTASAVPTQDIRNGQLLYRGQSVDFGRRAKIYANLSTINNLLNNSNPNDLFGKRTSYGETINNLAKYNEILIENDLPTLVPYDRGYYDDTGTFQLYIPNNVAIVLGARTNGARLGNYRLTRNGNNPNFAPGAYTKVVDLGEISVPRRIDVHDGHNGGPVIYFPGAVIVITC